MINLKVKIRVGEKVDMIVHGSAGCYVDGHKRIEYPRMPGIIIYVNKEKRWFTVNFGSHLCESYYYGVKA